jgi:hypothetical protein
MAVDYFDRLAEAAVKEAIQQSAAGGKRPTSRTVPPEAAALARQKSRSRLSESDAAKRVAKAIDRLRERKDIKAPNTPNAEWALIGQAPEEAAESR